MQIDESQIAELDSGYQKYKEWNVKASKKGVRNKQKNNVRINTEYIFLHNGE